MSEQRLRAVPEEAERERRRTAGQPGSEPERGRTAEQPGSEPERRLTVEQLAYETGMSVRNIRNHQSRGLLPPPDVRSRIGYYGPQHVERLRLIQEMQAEGFKLTAIERILGDQGAAAERFIGLRRAITAPFETEAPAILEVEDIVERFGGGDPRLQAKAEKL